MPVNNNYKFERFASKGQRSILNHITYNHQGIYIGVKTIAAYPELMEKLVAILLDTDNQVIKLELSDYGYKVGKAGARGKKIAVKGLPVEYGLYEEVEELVFKLKVKVGQSRRK